MTPFYLSVFYQLEMRCDVAACAALENLGLDQWKGNEAYKPYKAEWPSGLQLERMEDEN